MKSSSGTRAGVIGASLVLASNLCSIDAMAAPLIWGSGKWGDSWLGAIAVPSLSPLALGMLAAAIAAGVAVARRRRPAPVR